MNGKVINNFVPSVIRKKYILFSNGGAYINTGIAAQNMYDVKIEFYKKVATTSPAYIFGRNYSFAETGTMYLYNAASNASNRLTFQKNRYTSSTNLPILNNNSLNTIEIRSWGDIYVNGVSYSLIPGTAPGTITYPCYLFAINNNNTGIFNPSDWGGISSFYAKAQNGEPQINLIAVPEGNTDYSTTPAPANCMFDFVRGQYYVNQGNGFFDIMEMV